MDVLVVRRNKDESVSTITPRGFETNDLMKFQNLHLSYDALLRMTEATKQIFFGHPEAKSTPFGDICK